MKQTIEGLAKRLGFTIIPDWRLNSFPSERYLVRLFEYLQIDLVLDVGANVGQYHDMLRSTVGYTGQIVSFEPVPELSASLIDRSKADSKWLVDGRALGASAGTAEFNVMEGSEFSSFHAPRHDEISQFREQNAIARRIPVPVTTLDVELPELMNKFKPRGVYLKLDTQGHDLEVLKGATQVLSQIAALQTEASVRPIYEGAPGYQTVIDYLGERDFVMSGMFPNNTGHFPLLIEFDCYMIANSRVR